MIKELILFGASFGLCAALASSGAGCGGLPSSDCECPALPDRPNAVASRSVTLLAAHTEAGPNAQPENGKLAITPDTAVITYTDNGVDYEVVYSIDGRL